MSDDIRGDHRSQLQSSRTSSHRKGGDYRLCRPPLANLLRQLFNQEFP